MADLLGAAGFVCIRQTVLAATARLPAGPDSPDLDEQVARRVELEAAAPHPAGLLDPHAEAQRAQQVGPAQSARSARRQFPLVRRALQARGGAVACGACSHESFCGRGFCASRSMRPRRQQMPKAWQKASRKPSRLVGGPPLIHTCLLFVLDGHIQRIDEEVARQQVECQRAPTAGHLAGSHCGECRAGQRGELGQAGGLSPPRYVGWGKSWKVKRDRHAVSVQPTLVHPPGVEVLPT